MTLTASIPYAHPEIEFLVKKEGGILKHGSDESENPKGEQYLFYF